MLKTIKKSQTGSSILSNPVTDIITAALFFSTSGIWTKLSGQDAFVLSFFRAFIPVLFISILNIFRASGRKIIHRPDRRLLLASVLNAVRSLLFFQALIITSISKAVIMLYLWPVFVMGWNLLFKKEKVSFFKLVCILLAFAGIVVIYLENFLSHSTKTSDLYGMTIMMISSLIYSLTIILFKEQGKTRDHYEITFYQNLSAVPLFFAASIIRFSIVPDSLASVNLTGIAFACLNGLVPGIFGFVLYFKGMSRMESSKAGQLAYLEVVFSVLAGIVLFHENPGPSFFAGALLIIAAAVGRTFLRE